MSLPEGAELGSTTDPKALIKGEPSQVRANATRLSDESTRVSGLADDFDAITIAGWSGGFGEPAYASARSAEQKKWTAYADVLTKASKSLSTYAGALTTAQSKAADAIKKWQEAEAASDKAVTDYNNAVDNYNAYVNRQVCVPSYGGGPVTPSMGPGKPGPFVDPGDAMREEAKQILEDARKALDEAGMVAVEELGGLPGAKVETSSGPGASTEAKGPSIDWGNWSKTYGGGKPGTSDDGKPDSKWTINFGEVSAEAHAWGAEGSVEDYWGDVKVHADGKITVAGVEAGAGGKLDSNGLTAEAHAAATLIKLEGSAGGEWGIAEAEVKGEASVEAEAKGDLTIGKDGVHAGGEAFAGGKIEGSISGDVGGVGAEGKAEGWAGIGIAGDLDFGMKDGKFEIGGEGGIGLGLGGKLSGHITIDPVEIVETGGDIIDGIGDFLS
ncbi:putative T7SS-secreted protein [Nocardioides conyzicola]|uniref:WXG100 family type VII secretion target n=1 Tax=Nocardioides conyzicola TaxID=1651781 RepID=A0ABP8XIA7_9ACTN